MNGLPRSNLCDVPDAAAPIGIVSELSQERVTVIEKWWPSRFEKWVKQKNGEMKLLESYRGPRPFLLIASMALASDTSASTVKES